MVAFAFLGEQLKKMVPVAASTWVSSILGTPSTTFHIDMFWRQVVKSDPFSLWLVVLSARQALKKLLEWSNTVCVFPASYYRPQKLMGALSWMPSGNCVMTVRTMLQTPTRRQTSPPNSVLKVSSPLKLSLRGTLNRSSSEIHSFCATFFTNLPSRFSELFSSAASTIGISQVITTDPYSEFTYILHRNIINHSNFYTFKLREKNFIYSTPTKRTSNAEMQWKGCPQCVRQPVSLMANTQLRQMMRVDQW